MYKKFVRREEEILNICKNKNVLDLGCVAHSALREESDTWLHKRILKVAKSVVGVDYEKLEINKLNKKGYNIIYGDVERLNINKCFDVIIAGELIEHLMNPGLFLDSVKKHMHEKSIIIITTPNCFAIRRLIGSLFIRKLSENREHISYYSNVNLIQLLKRKNFILVSEKYYLSEDKNKILYFFEKLISLFIHKQNGHGLFFVFKLSK